MQMYIYTIVWYPGVKSLVRKEWMSDDFHKARSVCVTRVASIKMDRLELVRDCRAGLCVAQDSGLDARCGFRRRTSAFVLTSARLGYGLGRLDGESGRCNVLLDDEHVDQFQPSSTALLSKPE